MSHHTSASARAEHLHIGRSDLIPFDPFRLVQVPNVGVHNPMSCAGNLDRLKGRMGSLTLRLTLSLRAHSFTLRGWFVVERAYARLTQEHCTQISTPLQEKSLREDEFIAG